MLIEPKRKKVTRKRGRLFSLLKRDVEAMLYVWRWKVASTRSVHEFVNRDKSEYSTYKMLDRLERNHFLECRFNVVEQFQLWQLTELGFNTIKEYLPELKEDGYLSENHRHDRLVQAFQLGEWATYQLSNVKFCTEQELRRAEVENYPTWVPQTSEHRPDGYTKIIGAKKSYTLAFEVELSAKHVQRYESTLRFYRAARAVDRVLWLVPQGEVKDTILRAKACTKDDSLNFHLFVDLEEFEKKGWDAAVTNERSETLFTLREKYREITGDLAGELLGNHRGRSTVTVHLDNRKVIGKTKACTTSKSGTAS